MTHKPIIILDHPQMGENIGAVARAMMNCELSELRLVAPRDGWPNQKAYPMASGADQILDDAQVFETFQDAIADCHYTYAMTARLRDMNKPTYSPRQLMTELMPKKTGKTAFIFGAERSGLSNEDISLCTAIVEVPLNPEFSSLNLAQAVLLCAYEFYLAQDVTKSHQLEPSASHEKYQNFFD